MSTIAKCHVLARWGHAMSNIGQKCIHTFPTKKKEIDVHLKKMHALIYRWFIWIKRHQCRNISSPNIRAIHLICSYNVLRYVFCWILIDTKREISFTDHNITYSYLLQVNSYFSVTQIGYFMLNHYAPWKVPISNHMLPIISRFFNWVNFLNFRISTRMW